MQKVKVGTKTYDIQEVTLGVMSDIIAKGNPTDMLMDIASFSVCEKGKPLGLRNLRELPASAYKPIMAAVKDLHLPDTPKDKKGAEVKKA
jgi:hypothetical protein